MAGFRQPFFSTFRFIAPYFSTPWLIKQTGQKIIFPFYHLVSDEPAPHVEHLYPIKSTAEFEADMDFLLKHYHPIGLPDLLDFVQGKKRFDRPVFLLSFDDGLAEITNVVAPILKKKGIPAVCFLNSKFVDNQDLFFRYKVSLLIDFFKNNKTSQAFLEKDELLKLKYSDQEKINQLAGLAGIDFSDFLKKNQPYLTTKQINDLKQQGFYFGGHSIDHPEYQYLSEAEQLEQTITSVDFVQSKFDLPYRIFSFPFTDYGVSASFFNQLEQRKITQLSFGCAGIKKQYLPTHFQRIPFEAGTLSGEQILKTELFYFLLKKWISKN